jgi:hypothetical protein
MGWPSRPEAGSLFGLGQVISRMVDPLKVPTFSGVAGDWDPSPVFVLAVAIPAIAFGVVLGRHADRRSRQTLCTHRAGPSTHG